MGCGGSKPETSAVDVSSVNPTAKSGHQPAEFEAFFFPDSAMPCKHTLRGDTCTRRNCSYAHHTTSLSRMLEVLRSARRTLDVCVFSITVRFSIDG